MQKELQIDREPRKPWVEISFPLELQISNKVRGLFAPFEHDQYSLKAHKNEIQKIEQQCDILLLEYVPHEVDRVKNNFLVSPAKELPGILEYFPQIAEYAKANHKPLLRFDPAHNLDWALAFRLPFAAFLIPFAVAAIQNDLPFLKDLPQHLLNALPLLAIGTLMMIPYAKFYVPAILEQNSGKLSSFPNENMFRRANVMEKLITYGQDIDNNPNINSLTIGIFYPPLHCAGLYYMHTHEVERKKLLQITSPLKSIPHFRKSFFEGIQTDWNNDSQRWLEKTVVRI